MLVKTPRRKPRKKQNEEESHLGWTWQKLFGFPVKMAKAVNLRER
jgi:hypothetical protein